MFFPGCLPGLDSSEDAGPLQGEACIILQRLSTTHSPSSPLAPLYFVTVLPQSARWSSSAVQLRNSSPLHTHLFTTNVGVTGVLILLMMITIIVVVMVMMVIIMMMMMMMTTTMMMVMMMMMRRRRRRKMVVMMMMTTMTRRRTIMMMRRNNNNDDDEEKDDDDDDDDDKNKKKTNNKYNNDDNDDDKVYTQYPLSRYGLHHQLAGMTSTNGYWW